MKVRDLRWRFYRKTGGPRGWGNRCKTYCPGCILCEKYRFLYEHGRFPTSDEARQAGYRHETEAIDATDDFGEVPWAEVLPLTNQGALNES